ncbi:MAG: hypothetical protein ACRD8U_12695 [Pyrinomonadaceae bacterium]
MRINLHIDRLVLDGLPVTGAQGTAVQLAIQTELGNLLATHGLGSERPTAQTLPYASGEAIQLIRDAGPRQVGTQIAKSVHGSLTK